MLRFVGFKYKWCFVVDMKCLLPNERIFFIRILLLSGNIFLAILFSKAMPQELPFMFNVRLFSISAQFAL